MINALKVLFAAILALMLFVTVNASMERGVFAAGGELWRDAWFRATLADAYCGFVTFYAWVFYRERGLLGRLGWLVAILGLGNIAMAVYMLIRLYRLPAGAGVERLLLREPA